MLRTTEAIYMGPVPSPAKKRKKSPECVCVDDVICDFCAADLFT